MKHLGLKANGQPLCGGYYLRFISRVYEIELPKLDELPKLYLASL